MRFIKKYWLWLLGAVALYYFMSKPTITPVDTARPGIGALNGPGY
jgi:hypothetical protein